MLERIQGLPEGVLGIRAKGLISSEDYEKVIVPALEEARSKGSRVRFLYHFPAEFERFTASARWEDLHVGLKYLRLFERCAVVTDEDGIRSAVNVAAAMLPCPVRVFGNDAWNEAVEWVAAPARGTLGFRVLEDRKVAVLEPSGQLRAEDFDAVEARVDAWLEETGGRLAGLVVHAREFPGWENLGSMLRHLRFVRDHHRRVARVALAADGALGEFAEHIGSHFVEAEVKHFGHDQLEAATAWAAGEES